MLNAFRRLGEGDTIPTQDGVEPWAVLNAFRRLGEGDLDSQRDANGAAARVLNAFRRLGEGDS